MALSQSQIDGWGSFSVPEEEKEDLPMAGQQNLGAAPYFDPDRYAVDRELSKKTGVPIQAVEKNRAQVEADAEPLTAENWNTMPPGLKKYLEDPDASIVSQDDLHTLDALEREANRSWYEISSDTFKGLGDSMMIGMGKVYDQAMIGYLSDVDERSMPAEMLAQYEAALPPGELDRRRDDREQRIKMHIESLRVADDEIGRLTPEDLTIMEEGLRGGVQMISDMLPGLAVSVATRGAINPTLYYLTAKTGLEGYGSARVEGKGHDEALAYGGIDAALEFATERIPMKSLERIFGELGKGGVKSSIKKWAAQEMLGEQIATITQSINAYAFELDEELANAKDFGEILEIQGRRQAVTFISTLAGGGSMASSIKSVDYLVNRERRAMGKLLERSNKIRGSGLEQDRLDNLIYLAQAAKTNERAADLFEKFMQEVEAEAADGKPQVVYLDAAAVDLLENAPGYITEQMDGSGGNIAIPLATFLKDFANNEAQLELVRPFIKTKEGLSTQTELEEDTDSEYIKSLLAKAAEASETKSAADAIYERITTQLIATGRQSAATARQSAALIPAQVTTQYEYLKSNGIKNEDGSEITLEQLFADFGLEVVGPEADVAGDFMDQGVEEYRFEDGLKEPPVPGESFLAMRIGSGGELTNSNAGNAQAVAAHIARQEDEMGPTNVRFGDTVTIYSVEVEEDFGQYKEIRGREGAAGETQVGRARGMARSEGTQSVSYSFPEGANYQATEAVQIPYEDILVRLKERGYENMDDAGSRIGGEIIDEMVRERMPFVQPRVLNQQDFGTISITETVMTEDGDVFDLIESAQSLWQVQQERLTSLEALRKCSNG